MPLTGRAKLASAFLTPGGLYQYKVTPFGMKNAPATLQRLLNILTSDLDGCEVYLDDIVVFSDSWESNIARLEAVFHRFREANLTVNLAKSEFG